MSAWCGILIARTRVSRQPEWMKKVDPLLDTHTYTVWHFIRFRVFRQSKQSIVKYSNPYFMKILPSQIKCQKKVWTEYYFNSIKNSQGRVRIRRTRAEWTPGRWVQRTWHLCACTERIIFDIAHRRTRWRHSISRKVTKRPSPFFVPLWNGIQAKI